MSNKSYYVVLLYVLLVMSVSYQTEAATVLIKQSLTMSSSKKGQVSLVWKKDSHCSGYQVVMSTDKSFAKNTRSRTYGKINKVTVTDLQSQKTYYAKVRGIKKSSNGKKIYGKYSNVKKCKIK